MLSMSPLRCLSYSAAITFLVIGFLGVVLHFSILHTDDILDRLIDTCILTLPPAQTTKSAIDVRTLTELYLEVYHKTTPPLRPNPHIARFSHQCSISPNPRTNHIRLPHILHNISLVTANTTSEPAKSFFNPTFIPLPASYSTSPQYLLLTRLVTTGTHQESHLCLASICLPPHSPNPTSSGLATCTSTDLALLGPNGGMRCVTDPIQLNIPPTPARKCSGKWKTFVDIPGFHDPRVFWGAGQPLVLVNSGSAAPGGCVGLWLQDLRSLVPGLEEVLARGKERRIGGHELETSGISEDSSRGNGPARRHIDRGKMAEADDWDRVLEEMIEAKTEFPSLTEITRNPRQDRKEVEKNWVIFFPNDRETVVQYDLLGYAEEVEMLDVSHTTDLYQLKTASTYGPNYANSSIAEPNSNAIPTTNAFLKKHKRIPTGGRTLSKLSSRGQTTANLTSPHEPSCFDLMSHEHTHDALNNTGRWHQGSNALRLVLSTRSGLQTLYNEFLASHRHRHDKNVHKGDKSDEIGVELGSSSVDCFEDSLVEEGIIVHFSIVHRKFVNQWKLPMRYERYFVVWEARRPYRVVGVSRWPVLFGAERARPWAREIDLSSADVNGSRHGDIGTAEHEDFDDTAYFTYSPSLAWAWRPVGDDDEGITARMGGAASVFGNLGTGYLGDDVLIGVGLDDQKQGFVRVKVDEVLQCLRMCPGVDPEEAKRAP